MSDLERMIKEWNDPLGARNVPDAEDLIDALTETIQQLRDAQRWIPVSERLPEDGLCVLVEDYRGCQYVAHRTINHLTKQYEWTARGTEWHQGAPLREITHWMPLPEPPQETGQ